MSAPRSYLERTRGRILAESERVRVASEVQLVSGSEILPNPARGLLHLALTDRRLLLVGGSRLARRAHVLSEWPSGGLSISITRRRIGGNLIHVTTKGPSTTRLSFEWVRGQRPRDWEPYRFRQ